MEITSRPQSGRGSSKEWISVLQQLVHSQEQAQGTALLYCLWDVWVDRMACCILPVESPAGQDMPFPGMSLPHIPSIVRTLCVVDLGMTLFFVNTLLFAVRLQVSQKSPHLGAGSSQNTPQNQQDLYFRQKQIHWVHLQSTLVVVTVLLWARSLISFSALALLCGPNYSCAVQCTIFYSNLGSDHKILRP